MRKLITNNEFWVILIRLSEKGRDGASIALVNYLPQGVYKGYPGEGGWGFPGGRKQSGQGWGINVVNKVSRLTGLGNFRKTLTLLRESDCLPCCPTCGLSGRRKTYLAFVEHPGDVGRKISGETNGWCFVPLSFDEDGAVLPEEFYKELCPFHQRIFNEWKQKIAAVVQENGGG